MKSLLWGREDPLDELEPIVELADDTKQFDDIRMLIHSFEWVSSPGRLMRLYVKDKQTDKILGLIK